MSGIYAAINVMPERGGGGGPQDEVGTLNVHCLVSNREGLGTSL